jgi:dynein heavy chain 1
LREELDNLEKEEQNMKNYAHELEVKIVKLEDSLNRLQEEYAILIAKVENIKNDMKSCQDKVARSVLLIGNLSSERVRWDESSKNFVH